MKEQLNQEKESGLFQTHESSQSMNQEAHHTTSTNQIEQLNMPSVSEVKGLNFSDIIVYYVTTVIMTGTYDR